MNGTPEDRRKLWRDLFNLVPLINWRDCGESPCEDKETGWPVLTGTKKKTATVPKRARCSWNVDVIRHRQIALSSRDRAEGMTNRVGVSPLADCEVTHRNCSKCNVPKTTWKTSSGAASQLILSTRAKVCGNCLITDGSALTMFVQTNEIK